MYLNSFNIFRALAIIFIVTGHCFRMTNIKFDSFWEYFARNLIDGGTALFVFISGFLFHHIFYNRYRYSSFISKKLLALLLPYTLFAIIPIYFLVEKNSGAWWGFFRATDTGLWHEYILPTLKWYSTGRFYTAYWYIPFIVVTFLISPLHIWFIRRPIIIQLICVVSLLIVSCLIYRPVGLINVFQHLVYYTPLYLIGILCSMHKDRVYQGLKGKEIYLLVIVLALALFQAYSGHGGNYYKKALVFKGIDYMIFQKIALSLFFMIWLHRFENIKNKTIKFSLNYLAAASFAIYFMHPILLYVAKKQKLYFKVDIPWLALPLITISLILICLVLAIIVKKIIPFS